MHLVNTFEAVTTAVPRVEPPLVRRKVVIRR